MSCLGSDTTLLEERPRRHVDWPRDGVTDVSAAPLWTAFRDRYTRARERRHLTSAGAWVLAEEP